MYLLKVSALEKQQEGNWVVQNVHMQLYSFQKLAIAGETGSGKSSLLKMIAGLIQPDNGQIYFENQKILGPDEKLLPGHPSIGYLSQHFELRNNYRVEEILDMSLQVSEDQAHIIYDVCRISHLLKRKTNQLSGGEKQRIAVARLLISAPKLLLLDEPYSNLDMVHKNILKEVIRDIGEKLNITCILVSHDPQDLLSWADTIIVMQNGKIIQQGTPLEIYRQPVNEYTAGLFGKYTIVTLSLLHAYASLPGLEMNRNNMFIRPENFNLVINDSMGVPGKVINVYFLGYAYEAEILLGENIIIIKTAINIAKDDIVYVSLLTGGVWNM